MKLFNMKSIHSKIITFMLMYLILLAILIGAVSIVNTGMMARYDSDVILNEVCKEQAERLNHQLSIVEHAVNAMYDYSVSGFESVDRLSDKEYFDKYTESVREVSINLANHTDGSLAVYFRYNPEIVSNGVEGFFWDRKNENENFTKEEITDILAYDPDDIEHVGWFYIPVEAQKSVWMAPYYNKNIDKEMISYVMPFYDNGQLIGVIGMDIDFDIFADLVQDIELYRDCSAFIVNTDKREFYAKTGSKIEFRALDGEICDILETGAHSESLFRVVYEGKRNKLAFDSLGNGMKIIIMAPYSEIHKSRNRLIIQTVLITELILLLAVITAVYVTKRIVKPLKDLTEATKQYADGNWDVVVECDTRDEVKSLTDSVQTMASKTQEYIRQLNKQIMKDRLTGVKNFTCYSERIEKLMHQMAENPQPFAVVVFDINGLHAVNEKYGREKGDAVILEASRLICDIFKHSPVFRIGGDEFAVIMKSSDFDVRYELLAGFEHYSHGITVNEDDSEKISVEYGVANFPEEGNSYEAVFALANKRMNEKKNRKKE